MSRHSIRPAPDYTDAFLVSFGVLIFMFLWMITAMLGFVWGIAAGYGINWLFQRLSRKGTG
ncbi:MAG: hypothetical protein NWQ23_10085 [Yoonia sp.]|uniref:hypothetical protein n=1 Tax=Yoonia sp. TaxID=2212373 RepID=UPI00273F9F1D|nr:hypothetical protein [Yoonia sp.]MDP5085758.1 hypothetical protein [Yoonia sp.]